MNLSTVRKSPVVSFEAITDPVAERGYGKVDKQRIPLTDNEIIEEQLGKYGYVGSDSMRLRWSLTRNQHDLYGRSDP